jgi:hypothetical protein
MQAMKFNLLEKKAAATVHLDAAGVPVITRDYFVSIVAGREMPRCYSSRYLPPHAPPDRLSLYHCYLV